jgi:RecA-family ATPase
LVIIDPMSAYVGVGKLNNSSTTDVRGMLAPLTKLAEDTKISIIGIMHFNKKADVTNAMLRIADSLAYVAAARHVYVVVDDSENEKARLFVKAKKNVAFVF